MIEVHNGKIKHKHSFDEIYLFLKEHKTLSLTTSTGKAYDAQAKITRDGREVIIFYRGHKESARTYKCCWGSYYNCNRTRFGMYAKPLDEALWTDKGSLVMMDINAETINIEINEIFTIFKDDENILIR